MEQNSSISLYVHPLTLHLGHFKYQTQYKGKINITLQNQNILSKLGYWPEEIEKPSGHIVIVILWATHVHSHFCHL